MLLYSLPVEGKKQKEIFRPFDDTFSEIARVDSLITKWLKSSPLNSDVEVVLEKKSVNGDGTGVGAVWSAWVTVQIPKKHHSHLSKVKKVFEVKAFIPNRQIVLEISVDNNHSPTSACGECFRFKNKMPPAVLMFTAVDKGKSTEVTAQLNTAYPSMCQLFPKQIVFCPCFWPHLILIAATSLVCCPCCHVCVKNIAEQDLANQCDRGVSAIKHACENGPPTQVMADHRAPLVYAAPPSYGAVAAGAYDPPKLMNVVGDSSSCTKCGNPHNNTQDVFCGKCGTRR